MLELEPIRIARNRAIQIPAHKGSADSVSALFSPPSLANIFPDGASPAVPRERGRERERGGKDRARNPAKELDLGD